ncbi:MAG TPA: hypothetical protein VMD29_05050, partial [Terracidiphilus sp.]|nr:hypothetical protein [Terracidiphilus sp.]
MLEIEEEQHRTMLAAAIADLRRLEAAWDAAKTRDREGRRLVVASAVTNQLADRLAGLEETRVAQRKAAALQPRMVDG